MSSGIRVATPPPRPVMVFDGDCGFCKLWIRRWRQMTGEEVDYLPAQDPRIEAQFPEIPRERFDVAVHLIEADGQVYAGAEAVVRAMAHAEEHRWPWRAYQFSPALAKTMELGYRVVANHRVFFSWLTRRLWGRHVEQPTHHLVQWFFLRALGLIYLAAFLSLWPQIGGLIGHDGILPVDRLMAGVRQQYDLHGIGWERREIVVEGSDDGTTWLPFEFKHKPGDVNRRPTFVAPQQPRLDWQMWFAALGNYRHHPWFVAFCIRLLQGKPEVLALLRNNPFPDHAPKFVRAELYAYDFTESAERLATRAWWRRERVGEYLPAISLESLRKSE